jgi:tRNA-dihydrouridine synthase B
MNKIGKLKLRGELFLAPMADYTNVAFRTLSCEYGAALVYTELISAKALLMKSKRTESMLAVSETEKPVFLQLFGSKPTDFAEAVKLVEKKYPNNFAGFDLNSGCSVPKALKGKYGCTLMNDASNVGQIISLMKSSTDKPVTIKMRLGLNEETFLKVAESAIENKVDAITLHPRFGSQGYSGNADWEKIKLLKNETKKAKVPIIGNGDIKSPSDVILMKEKTGCDFEMIGRASMGNAFFFKQANALLKKEEAILKNFDESKKEGERFFELADKFNLNPNEIRPYFLGLSKGLIGASVLRNSFGMSKTKEDMKKIFYKYFE